MALETGNRTTKEKQGRHISITVYNVTHETHSPSLHITQEIVPALLTI